MYPLFMFWAKIGQIFKRCCTLHGPVFVMIKEYYNPFLLNSIHITKTCPCNIQRFFRVKIMQNFQWKNFDIFLIFAQNIDHGYTLEPPGQGSSNAYPQFMFWTTIRKIGIPLHTRVLLYKTGV